MKNAIQKAIEGGYKDEKSQCYRCGIRRSATQKLMIGCSNDKGLPYKTHMFRRPTNRFEVYLLDPLFWSCIGKAMGWKEECEGALLKGFSHNQFCDDCVKAGWSNQWHRFIDKLASGGDAESFFTELIK